MVSNVKKRIHRYSITNKLSFSKYLRSFLIICIFLETKWCEETRTQLNCQSWVKLCHPQHEKGHKNQQWALAGVRVPQEFVCSVKIFSVPKSESRKLVSEDQADMKASCPFAVRRNTASMSGQYLSIWPAEWNHREQRKYDFPLVSPPEKLTSHYRVFLLEGEYHHLSEGILIKTYVLLFLHQDLYAFLNGKSARCVAFFSLAQRLTCDVYSRLWTWSTSKGLEK